MTNLFLPLVAGGGDVNDPVNFTFFIGCMAMMAASAFFFLSLNQFDKKWRTSVLVSGLITFIAAVHYFYMRDYWASNMESPTFFRYVDWILTVPLMCVEFYLLTKAAGAKIGLLWKLIIASVWMLVTGYIGEAFNPEGGSATHSMMWGVLSSLGYVYIVYTAWYGEVAKLAESSGNENVKKGVTTFPPFVPIMFKVKDKEELKKSRFLVDDCILGIDVYLELAGKYNVETPNFKMINDWAKDFIK